MGSRGDGKAAEVCASEFARGFPSTLFIEWTISIPALARAFSYPGSRGASGVQPRIPPVKTQITALVFVSGDEGTVGVVVDHEMGDFFTSERESEAPDATGGGAVRTAGASHDGTEDIVEDARGSFHWWLVGDKGFARGWTGEFRFYSGGCAGLIELERRPSLQMWKISGTVQ